VCTGGAFLIAVRDANPDEGDDGVTGNGTIQAPSRWPRR